MSLTNPELILHNQATYDHLARARAGAVVPSDLGPADWCTLDHVMYPECLGVKSDVKEPTPDEIKTGKWLKPGAFGYDMDGNLLPDGKPWKLGNDWNTPGHGWGADYISAVKSLTHMQNMAGTKAVEPWTENFTGHLAADGVQRPFHEHCTKLPPCRGTEFRSMNKGIDIPGFPSISEVEKLEQKDNPCMSR